MNTRKLDRDDDDDVDGSADGGGDDNDNDDDDDGVISFEEPSAEQLAESGATLA